MNGNIGNANCSSRNVILKPTVFVLRRRRFQKATRWFAFCPMFFITRSCPMNKGLRNELITLCGLGALACLVLRRPRAAAGFGLAAGSVALLGSAEEVSFRKSNVVITGGSRGLGLALARELVREGARVVLVARDAQEL